MLLVWNASLLLLDKPTVSHCFREWRIDSIREKIDSSIRENACESGCKEILGPLPAHSGFQSVKVEKDRAGGREEIWPKDRSYKLMDRSWVP
jgi:hypothetical protein